MQHQVHQTLSLIPDNLGRLCSLSFPHSFLPMSVPPWMSHVIQEELRISCFSVFTQMHHYFSLPEGPLTALGLLPMWFFLVSLFPSSRSLCSSCGPLLSFLAYQCFLRCQWRLLNSLQTFLIVSCFLSLEVWSSLSLSIFHSGLLHPFCLIAKLNLSTPCWVILYFSQLFFLFCGTSLLKVL